MLLNRQGGESGAAALGYAIRLPVMLVKVLGSFPSARRVGFIGEGGFLRGSAELSASPVPTSLVTFLFGDKKVTAGVRQIPVYRTEAEKTDLYGTGRFCCFMDARAMGFPSCHQHFFISRM